mmetsp:Transcript_85732/g.165043  ORF Transcript_85732/g.165043 Transcript_85732/m.165043 type:complete len:276 (+) Transcript_85732:800-1627(+)
MERRYLAHWSINHLDCMQFYVWRNTDTVAANDGCTESSMAVSIHSTVFDVPTLFFDLPKALFELRPKGFEFGHGTSFEFPVRGADARVENINLHALALLIAHGFKFPMQRAAFLIDQVKAPWQPCFFQTFRLLSSFRINIQCPVCPHLWGTIPAMHCQLLPYTFMSALHGEKTQSSLLWVTMGNRAGVGGHVFGQGFEVLLPAAPFGVDDPLTTPRLCHGRVRVDFELHACQNVGSSLDHGFPLDGDHCVSVIIGSARLRSARLRSSCRLQSQRN